MTSASGSVTVTKPGGFKRNLAKPMASLRVFTSCVTSSVRAEQDGHFEGGNCVFNIQHASLTYAKMLFAFVTSRLQPQGHRLVSLRVKGSKHTLGSQDRLNEKEANVKVLKLTSRSVPHFGDAGYSM